MFKTLLRHKILELSINNFFDKLTVNFHPHKVGEPIKVKDLKPIPVGRMVYGVKLSTPDSHYDFILPQPLNETVGQCGLAPILECANNPHSHRKTFLILHDDDDIFYI